MFVVKNRKIFFSISAILVLLSIISMLVWGFNFGIDFTGGSILEVEYLTERPSPDEIKEVINIGEYLAQPTGDRGYIIRTKDLSEEERLSLISSLSFGGNKEFQEKRFNTIGPVIGNELRQKALLSILLVVLAIILFIAFAFRKVSKPVSSWKYGLVAIVALIHDIIIPTGIFITLGALIGVEIDILFVTALLAILGFSVNDTIVVFDRVRENLRLNEEYKRRESFEETIGKSLNQTYTRSINTSLTTLFVLLALFFLGGDSTRYFTLTLIIGVLAGTYSSIFLASPLLVVLGKGKD